MVGEVAADAVARADAEGLERFALVGVEGGGGVGCGGGQVPRGDEAVREVEVARGVVGGVVRDLDGCLEEGERG